MKRYNKDRFQQLKTVHGRPLKSNRRMLWGSECLALWFQATSGNRVTFPELKPHIALHIRIELISAIPTVVLSWQCDQN